MKKLKVFQVYFIFFCFTSLLFSRQSWATYSKDDTETEGLIDEGHDGFEDVSTLRIFPEKIEKIANPYDEVEGSGDEMAEFGDDDEWEESSGYDDEYDYDDSMFEDLNEEVSDIVVPDNDEENSEVIDDIHFAEDPSDSEQDDDLLYEYYNEDYTRNEDQGDILVGFNISDVITSVGPVEPNDGCGNGKFTSYMLVVLFGLAASFGLFSVALCLWCCCCRRRRQRLKHNGEWKTNKKFAIPYVIEASFVDKAHLSQMSSATTSSIVKNYSRVPTSAKHFLEQPSPPINYNSTSCLDEAQKASSSPLSSSEFVADNQKPLLF